MADLEGVRALSAADHLAVLATTRADGSVHVSVVSAGVMDDPVDGTPGVGLVVQGQARKRALLRRAGRAAVVFRDGYRWAAVEGPVRMVGPDEAGSEDVPGVIRAVFRAAGGDHEDWDEFDRVMAAERRCAVFVHAERVTGNPASG